MPKERKVFTVSSTVLQPFTRDNYGGKIPVFLHLEVQDNPIVYSYDGQIPTVNEGHNLAAGGFLIFENGDDIENLKIRAVSTDARGIATVGV